MYKQPNFCKSSISLRFIISIKEIGIEHFTLSDDGFRHDFLKINYCIKRIFDLLFIRRLMKIPANLPG